MGAELKPAPGGTAGGREGVTFLSPAHPSLQVFVGPSETIQFQDGKLATTDRRHIAILDGVDGVFREDD